MLKEKVKINKNYCFETKIFDAFWIFKLLFPVNDSLFFFFFLNRSIKIFLYELYILQNSTINIKKTINLIKPGCSISPSYNTIQRQNIIITACNKRRKRHLGCDSYKVALYLTNKKSGWYQNCDSEKHAGKLRLRWRRRRRWAVKVVPGEPGQYRIRRRRRRVVRILTCRRLVIRYVFRRRRIQHVRRRVRRRRVVSVR